MSSNAALRRNVVSNKQQYCDLNEAFSSGLDDIYSRDSYASDSNSAILERKDVLEQECSSNSDLIESSEFRNGSCHSAVVQSKDLSGLSNLDKHLNDLVCLVANATESYSSVIFKFAPDKGSLFVAAFHTLSRDFLQNAKINPGAGLVGWTAQNKVRISVCPFQHDARTLLYYSSDQGLKSFIAIPIVDSNEKLLGVLCCDSKKSYAFTKLTEKVLYDCARQSAILMELHNELDLAKVNRVVDSSVVPDAIELLRDCTTEEDLLSSVCSLSQEIISRDALVVITVADKGIGQGSYYSVSRENRFNNRLLELVCKHKKVLCPNRSVHVSSTNDMEGRSFLSVPFHVLGREAGSLNLLSRPHEPFRTSDISVLERIAQIVSEKLEHIRLKDRVGGAGEQTSSLSWNLFEAKAGRLLEDARSSGLKLVLLRLQISKIDQIEDICGAGVSCAVIEKVARIIDQVSGQGAVSCCIYGTQFLVLIQKSEVSSFYRKFRALIDRFDLKNVYGRNVEVGFDLRQFLKQSICSVVAVSPEDGVNVFELMSKTSAVLSESRRQNKSLEVLGDAGWS